MMLANCLKPWPRVSARLFRTFSSIPHLNSNPIRTAGCIIIGDEVLNSKITDTNSKFFGKYCFQNGIQLSKVSIIGDDEAEIMSTVREFDSKYDFIITSGGIGPTHDDVTYESISKTFGLEQKIDEDAKERMYTTYKDLFSTFTQEQKQAGLKMVYLPVGEEVETLYAPDLWVPIVTIKEKLFILPGIPKLFEKMLTQGIHNYIEKRLDPELEFQSFFVSTNVKESALAPVLSRLLKEIKSNDIKIGSYPHKVLNTVSITGRQRDSEEMRKLVATCIREFNGKEISREEEEALSNKSYDI